MKPLLFLAVLITAVMATAVMATAVMRLPDVFDDDPHWRP